MGGKKLWGIILCIMLVFALMSPALAQEKRGFPITKNDLRHLNPARHPYFFSVLGGGAIGAAAGELLGSGNDVVKGLLIGSGGASAAYLHTHPHSRSSYRPVEYLASDTALGTGIGWTICGCTDGAWGGGLIGFGASAIGQTTRPQGPRRTTASTKHP